jgi:hypothetical protein
MKETFCINFEKKKEKGLFFAFSSFVKKKE